MVADRIIKPALAAIAPIIAPQTKDPIVVGATIGRGHAGARAGAPTPHD
jgi:hypothetical protein